MAPLSGLINPNRCFNNTDLPEPLLPITTTHSPALILKSTPFKTSLLLKDL